MVFSVALVPRCGAKILLTRIFPKDTYMHCMHINYAKYAVA